MTYNICVCYTTFKNMLNYRSVCSNPSQVPTMITVPAPTDLATRIASISRAAWSNMTISDDMGGPHGHPTSPHMSRGTVSTTSHLEGWTFSSLRTCSMTSACM